MPDEYISREAAIEEIDKWLDTVGTALVGKGMSYYGEMIGCIEDARAANVAEVAQGHWIMHNDDFGLTCECSHCHIETMGDSEYCLHCGARMDGGSE